MTLLDERIHTLQNLLDMADLAASSFSTASSSTLLLAREALSLLNDLVVRDTLLVILVVGRALLTDGIVHSTLLVDEVVLGALRQTRHSLDDCFC